VSGGDIWVDLDCFTDQLNAALDSVGLQRERAEQMQYPKVARFLL
jgi:hypothetical protein